jgi:hypothetical protein
MYRWFGVVPQGLIVSLSFPLFLVIFGAFSGDFLGEVLRPFSLGFGGWCMHEPFVILFPSIPLPNLWEGAQFWGFLLSRVIGVLGGNSSVPLDLASFGGPNLGYGMPMRYSYYPQSLVRIRGANQEIRIWIWRSWPADCCSSREPTSWPFWPVPLTGLTGADLSLGFARVNILVTSLLSYVATISSLVSFGAQKVCLEDLGFPGLDRSDRHATPAGPV